MTKKECRCPECAEIHQEFISYFGSWPSMNHAEGQKIKANRESNLESWDKLIGTLDGKRWD